MRVALFTPYLPAPANTGGRIRMHRLARALAQLPNTFVDLFAAASPSSYDEARNDPALAVYDRVHVRSGDLGTILPWFNANRARRCAPWRLAKDLVEAHHAAPIDCMIASHSYTAALARRLPWVPLVVDEHNIESAYHSEWVKAQRGSASWRDRRENALLQRWEKHTWTTASLVTCVTEEDAALIREVRATNVHVVPNGTDAREIAFTPPSQRTGNTILFVGLLIHPPNVRAALRLANEILPRVQQQIPDARLVLCGRQPSREVLALQSNSIEVTGTVDSVHPYLASAAVYANALEHGAGSSLKVVEALAAGLPLVSNAMGVRGFGLEPETHYLHATSDDEMTDAIVRALRERNTLDAMSERAHTVAAAHDWLDIGQRFAQLVHTTVGNVP